VHGESCRWILDDVDKANYGHSSSFLLKISFKLENDLSMVIQVFSIYKSVLETDIVKQKIACFSNDDSDVSSNVSIKKI